MLKNLTPSDRLSLLADHMERTPMCVDMSMAIYCAYGHACHLFHEPFAVMDGNVQHFSRIMHIPEDTARSIYIRTNDTREKIVAYLRELSNELAHSRCVLVE